jgi:glyoxylase I family protein
MTTAAPSQPRQSTRPAPPSKLSHSAYITRDTEATVDFYVRILGMELVQAVLDDAIPSTGEPVPYFHSFFRMADGSTVAFFEAPDLPPLEPPPHPAYSTFQHLALEVASPAIVDGWKEWLEANDVEVLGPVDHKIIYSIYFHDPNGLRLELTAPLTPAWNDNAAGAQDGLAEWVAVKQEAARTGIGLPQALAELTSRRSHRRSSS